MADLAANPIRILIVDDESGPADALEHAIQETIGKEKVRIQKENNFANAKLILSHEHPYEAVVLDLFLGSPSEGENEGRGVWEQVKNGKFMPVVIYTAGEESDEPDFPQENPLLKLFQKRSENLAAIANHLKEMIPYIVELRSVQDSVNAVIKNSLLKTAPLLWQAEPDSQQRPERLLRSIRRRLAAMMDLDMEPPNQRMLYWEQYIIPALGNSPLMGDLLKYGEADAQNIDAYRLVLTPSCDMVTNKGVTKVSSALVAKCKNATEFLAAAQLGGAAHNKLKEKLPTLLTTDQTGGYRFLPRFGSFIPTMAADMRDLELIPLSEIGTLESEAKFVRLASIDSPFREQISWAYVQIAGRPGLPDRDAIQCVEENFIQPPVATEASKG